MPHTIHLVIFRPQPTQEPQAPQENVNLPRADPVHFQRFPPHQQNQAQQQHQQQHVPQQAQQHFPQNGQQNQQENQGGNQALLIKLTILVFILSRGGGTFRAAILLFGAFLLYLYLTGRFRIQINHYGPRVRNQENTGEAQGEQGHQEAPVDRGIVGEISDIVIPFISSLAPTWNPYEMNMQHQQQQQQPRNPNPQDPQQENPAVAPGL